MSAANPQNYSLCGLTSFDSSHLGIDVFNKEILLQKRSINKKLKPSKLCIPGGHLNTGETYLEGAKRELFEEMFHDRPLQEITFEELFKIQKSAEQDSEFITLFRISHPGPFFLDPNEVESFFFEDIQLTIKKIETNPDDYTQTTCILIKEYAKRLF